MKSSSAFFGLGTCALSLFSTAFAQVDALQDPALISMAPMFQASASKSSAAPTTKPVQVAACPRSGPYLSMEYLYWKVQEEQMYPFILVSQKMSGDLTIGDAQLKSQKFDCTSGFRAALGYDLPYEKYDLCFAWTRIHPHTSMNLSTTSSTELVSLYLQDLTTGVVGSAISKWHLAFDMLDLELGRKYVVGKHLTLRPNIGLKGGWINQTQSCSLQDVIVDPGAPLIDGTTKRTNDFQGIGPRLGIDMRYGIGSQFGVFGTVSGALLYGHFDLKTNIFLSPAPSAHSPHTFNFINSRCRLAPTAQMLLGGDWSRCLYQKWWIRFGAAYEVQFWWDQMGSNTDLLETFVVNYNAGGDLMMNGLTLQARFDF